MIWWTKTLPSNPGYYFFYKDNFTGIVKVYKSFSNRLYAAFPGIDGGTYINTLNGWWSDKPIEIPERKHND